jgi:hypothetical protein
MISILGDPAVDSGIRSRKFRQGAAQLRRHLPRREVAKIAAAQA